MNDKELLELAAKAQGWIDYPNDPVEAGEHWFEESKKAPLGIRRRKSSWNPLTDDGDALRLAVKLRIDFQFDGDENIEAWFTAPRSGWDNGQIWSWTEPLGNDPYAATRRAIVRAAAEIGKEMK